MDSGESGMGPVTMTDVNRQKGYRPIIEPATYCSQVQQGTDLG